MEDPSTIRKAVADMGAPYGGDSPDGQTIGGVVRWENTAYTICSMFAICSFRLGYFLPRERLFHDGSQDRWPHACDEMHHGQDEKRQRTGQKRLQPNTKSRLSLIASFVLY